MGIKLIQIVFRAYFLVVSLSVYFAFMILDQTHFHRSFCFEILNFEINFKITLIKVAISGISDPGSLWWEDFAYSRGFIVSLRPLCSGSDRIPDGLCVKFSRATLYRVQIWNLDYPVKLTTLFHSINVVLILVLYSTHNN